MSNKIVGVRINQKTREILDRVCNARQENLSNFVRRAILKELGCLGFLSDEQRQSLGTFEGDSNNG